MRQYLLQRDKEDKRDYLYSSTQAEELPRFVDLRNVLEGVDIYDQGHLGSCTANAICMLKIYRDRVEHTDRNQYFHNLSRLFLSDGKMVRVCNSCFYGFLKGG